MWTLFNTTQYNISDKIVSKESLFYFQKIEKKGTPIYTLAVCLNQ